MARIVREATPKRRSARLSSNNPQSTQRPNTTSQLGSVAERDETPQIPESPTASHVVSTPNAHRNLEDRFRELSKMTTPKTESKPASDQMHPATVHQTTAKAPDSGMKLGFADITTTGNASLASLQNTPSRPRQSLARTNISPTFEFKFSHEPKISEQGRKLMESIRGDAARIKEEMRAKMESQAQEEMQQADAGGRRIARPVGKTGRFSDVHMAQFKKMDSIENHASSFRARPGFVKQTAQSLKRTSSKADLDEPERPRTAGKGSVTRIPPPVSGRPGSTSPFKTINPGTVDQQEAHPKRLRHEGDSDVSSSRSVNIPRPVASRLLSPTKASVARSANGSSTPTKSSAIPRANSVKSIRSVQTVSVAAPMSPNKISQLQLNKPLPAPPSQSPEVRSPKFNFSAVAPKSLTSPVKEGSKSRLPMLDNLRSILRSPRKGPAVTSANTPKQPSNLPVPASSHKKVDFTPSVKSRYAVKLAENSPSPAKVDRSRPSDHFEPAIPYDSRAFIVHDYNEDWEDEDSEVVYPTLPNLSPRPGSSSGVFVAKAKDYGRRESKEFKSIFTTIQKNTADSLTAVNTNVNRTNPITNASRIALSPQKPQPPSSTIRRVRVSEPVQPFEDTVRTVPHGIPGKKRRIQSETVDDKFSHDDDAKENRRVTRGPNMPGSWNEDAIEATVDEGEQRGGKRMRIDKVDKPVEKDRSVSPVKKSAARETAAKNAKSRKAKASIGGASSEGKGILSMSRLNMLARPKSRG